MAVFSHIPVPSSGSGGIEKVFTATLATATASSEIALGSRQLFMITAFAATAPTGVSNINLKFGPSGLTAAAATDMGLPISGPTFSVAPIVFDTGEEFQSISIFNATSASVTYYVMKLTRT